MPRVARQGAVGWGPRRSASTIVSGVTETLAYTLACTGPSRSAGASVTIAVTTRPPPPRSEYRSDGTIVTFALPPSAIPRREGAQSAVPESFRKVGNAGTPRSLGAAQLVHFRMMLLFGRPGAMVHQLQSLMVHGPRRQAASMTARRG